MATFRFLNAVREMQDNSAIEKLRYFGNTDRHVDVAEWDDTVEVLYPPAEALRFAIMYGNVSYTRYILEKFAQQALGVTVCCPLLLLAVRLNNEIIVELLCSYGRRVRTKCGYYIDSRGCDLMEGGKSALHTAVDLGHHGCTKLLLKYGADPRCTDSDNQTVLERACMRLKKKHSVGTLLCILEVAYSEKQIQPLTMQMLNDLKERWNNPNWFVGVYSDMKVQVSSLYHLCRSTVRENLQRNLPDGIAQLPIPYLVKDYLDVSYNAAASES